MIIGIPKEIKEYEYRIPITPALVKNIVDIGHTVLIQKNLCEIYEYSDLHFKNAGAIIVDKPEDIWAESNIILKVKEPLLEEYTYFRKDLILFCFLHLASNLELTKKLLEKEVTAIGFETIQNQKKEFPILAPMSEIAGKLSPQLAAQFLLKYYGKKGIILDGITGVKKGKVLIIGCGTAGIHAARISLGLGAKVQIMDIDIQKLKIAENLLGNSVETLYSNLENLAHSIRENDIIIGSIYISGKKTPRILTTEMLQSMSYGSIIFDISIDQGGITEISKPTTHKNPIIEWNNILYYGVPNIPSLAAKTAIQALNNAIQPYLFSLLSKPIPELILQKNEILTGIQCLKGKITHPGIAESLHLEYKDILDII